MTKRRVQFVSSSGPVWPWLRQFPERVPTWGDSDYALDTVVDFVPDWLVVYEGWAFPQLITQVPRERRILVCAEPQSFHRYQRAYLNQFAHVITTQQGVRHPGAIASQVAINWFAGVRFEGPRGPFTPVLNFSDFSSGNPPKSKLCSVVCSTKAVTKGHRQRLAFVERLQREFGDRIDVYGRGFRDIRDKDEALADYRFHIALENSSHPHYWTEKLADPFLRGCFPIYSGCPNLADYFPAGSYVRIDLDRPGEALETIRGVLQSHVDTENAAALAEAKRRILWEHNIFSLLERIYPRLEARPDVRAAKAGSPVALLTDHDAKNLRLRRRISRYLRGLFSSANADSSTK